MSKYNRDRALSGINPLSYVGVEPSTPPQLVQELRAPTVNDYYGYLVGTIWLVRNTNDVYLLVDKNNHIANWISLTSGGLRYQTDNGIAMPHVGILNVLGGVNVHTEALAPLADTVTVNLIDHPTLAGGLTITPLAAPGVVTTDAAGLFNSTNGTDRQIIVARAAGPQWADLFSSDGTVLIDDSIDPLHPNGINLRSAGGGGGGCAGLTGDVGGTATPDAITGFIDVIGSDVIRTVVSAPSELTIDVEDSPAPGPNAGYVVMGAGPALPSGWGRLYSSDASVVVTPGVGPEINLTVAPAGGGVALLTADDAGTAVPDALHNINILGVAPFTTTAAGNTLNIGTGAPNLDGRILISTAGGPATWRTLTPGANVTIQELNDGAGQIVISAAGGGAVGGIQQLDCDSGVAVNPPLTNIVRIEGQHGTYNISHVTHPYQNIYTSCPGGADTDLVNLRLTSTIQLPVTNAGGTAGVIMLGTQDFMHAYGTYNTFLGHLAGNRTLTTADAKKNTCIGYGACPSINKSSNTTALGYGAGGRLELGSPLASKAYNTFIGSSSGYNMVSARYVTAIGHKAGYGGVGTSITTSYSSIFLGARAAAGFLNDRSHAIHIGNQGSGDDEQDQCFIAGIYGAVPNPAIASNVVLIDDDTRLSVAGGAYGTGQVLMGRSGLSPVWGNVTSVNNTIEITDNIGSINLEQGSTHAFSAYLPVTLPSVTGDGTVVVLGATRILTETYDPDNYFYVGDGAGAAARYTAAVSGFYTFCMSTRFVIQTPAPPPPPPVVPYYDPLYVKIYNAAGVLQRTYELTFPLSGYLPGVATTINAQFTVYTLMTATNYATFSISAHVNPSGKYVSIGAGAGDTYVAGFMVSKI